MASGNKSKDKEGAGAEEATEAAKGSRKRGKGSERAPAAPGRAKKAKGTLGEAKTPGRVVAVGLDVPTIAELAAEAEAAKKVEAETKGGPGAGRPQGYSPLCRDSPWHGKLGARNYEIAEEFGVKT